MSTAITQDGSLSRGSKEERLLEYLRERVAAEGGELYFKSKFIASDVDLSAKEIGALMLKLCNGPSELAIERWSYTSATTWRVST